MDDLNTTKPTAAKTAPVTETPAPSQLETKLRAWVYETFADGPIARNTECWNALLNALPDLSKRLS